MCLVYIPQGRTARSVVGMGDHIWWARKGSIHFGIYGGMTQWCNISIFIQKYAFTAHDIMTHVTWKKRNLQLVLQKVQPGYLDWSVLLCRCFSKKCVDPFFIVSKSARTREGFMLCTAVYIQGCPKKNHKELLIGSPYSALITSQAFKSLYLASEW